MSTQAASTSPTPHPLLQVGKGMLSDLIATLAFAALYALTHDVYLSVGVGMALGVGQIVWLKLRRRPIDAMQWLSLCLVIVFGSAALITRNPLFIMLKPSLVYLAVGAVMLRPGWMNRYMPPVVHDYGADVTMAFGYAWSALMCATAAANLALALLASHAAWAWFIAVVPLVSKVALVLTQYTATRTIVRRRVRAAAPLAVPAS